MTEEQEYEKATSLRVSSDDALDSLMTMAEEGATASEMLKKVVQLKSYLEEITKLEGNHD